MSEPNVPALLAQLAEAREQLRQERAAAKPLLVQAEQARREAEQLRRRTRRAATRFLKRTRAKLANETARLADRASQLGSDRRVFEADKQAWDVERVRTEERMHEAQRAFLEQQAAFTRARTEQEAELSRLFQLLEARTRTAEELEKDARKDRQQVERMLQDLRAEAAGLEERVANARAALAEYTQRRTLSANEASHPWADVALNESTGGGLQTAEALAARDQLHLAQTRHELDAAAERLADQHTLLSEKYAKLVAFGREFRSDELQTVDELERLARELAEREAVAAKLDAGRREREQQLWAYQQILERWHTVLAERENQLNTHARSVEAELTDRRAVVRDRESALDVFAADWQKAMTEWSDKLTLEVQDWASATRDLRTAAADWKGDGDRLRTTAVVVAAGQLALEQRKAELDASGQRRVRVLTRVWEKRFERVLEAVDQKVKLLITGENRLMQAVDARLKKIEGLDLAIRTRQSAALTTRATELRRVPLIDPPHVPDAPTAFELNRTRFEAGQLACTLGGLDDTLGIVRLTTAD